MKPRETAAMGGERRGGDETVVVVGVKMDRESRELLTWALVKVAREKDRVFAIHVLPRSSSPFGRLDNSSAVGLMKELDDLLGEYEGLCALKQINLQVKICRGTSVGKILVREVCGLSATSLVLGTGKNSFPIGSPSTTIAKYCAKKLPPKCWVLAVNNGKIAFERPPSVGGNPLAMIRRAQPFSRSSYLLQQSNGNSFCLLPADKFSGLKSSSGCPLPSSRKSQSTRMADCVAHECECQEEESQALFPVECKPLLLSQAKLGWPLLGKKDAYESSKMSVVQWAMKLPGRDRATPAIEWSNQRLLPVATFKSGAILPLGDVEKEQMRGLPKELGCFLDKYASTCRLFSYQEIAAATSNFSPENLVGKGGSSHVYKGLLSDGRELAVKILKQSEESLGTFMQEIQVITTLHHKNIASLFGFCFENNNLILLYDFFSRGSLEDNLHGMKVGNKVLSWSERYKTAIGVAEALAYLHNDGDDQSVVHRDVKSSNILLSDDFEPQLSDFGLAAMISPPSSYITCSDVAGTFGYLAPEYFMFGKVNEKIDVYAFGVILLELLSGRKPIDNANPKGKESLVLWAKPILQGEKPKQLLDPKLGSCYDDKQVENMILASSLCIRKTARTRPKISIVLKLLKGDESMTKWARLQVGLYEEMDETATFPASDLQSHLNLALLDVEDDALSVSSSEHCVDHILAQGSLEAYLQGRWSQSLSFD